MDEPGSLLRRSVVFVMALMVAVWIALYFLSFNDERGQAKPADFSFEGQSAKAGKKVFQAYNCMGCHTMLGNGAYFAPDLTNIFETAGPAWLAAYLPSAGAWPTETLPGIQIERMARQGLIEQKQNSLQSYYVAYPGAQERIRKRGGQSANMPNLAFRPDEVNALIAFLSYTSAMNTEGWHLRHAGDRRGLFRDSRNRAGRTRTRSRHKRGQGYCHAGQWQGACLHELSRADGAGNAATANFPRLSGLDGAYIAKQIADYKKGSRINAAMQPIATALTEKEAGDVGAYYASQRVEAVAPPASAEQMALGEKLATRGNWVKEIPACFSCHARGARASVLSLRLPDNTQATASDRSTHGRTARENDPVGLMKGIAERLSDEETAAVSAYLATLKSRK